MKVPKTDSHHTDTHTMFLVNFRSNDPKKPSFFEMYAQEQLTLAMKPALEYVLSVCLSLLISLSLSLSLSLS